jgi:MFS transporter, PAT family, beta-lactamase induction signal transducer AmpG
MYPSYLLKIYKHPYVLPITCLSFSCGLPFLLIVSTLPIWLKDANRNLEEISYIFLVGAPYSFKFLWSPLVDQIKLPFLTDKLGKRRSWALFAQIWLILSTLGLAHSHPETNVGITVIFALLVSFFASIQDIVLDAYRIERLSSQELGIGTSMSGIGFRLGLLAAGSGSIYLANYYDWTTVYSMMALLMVIGPIVVLLIDEPHHPAASKAESESAEKISGSYFTAYWLGTLRSFLDIRHYKGWPYIILFILLFKVSDSIPNSTSGLFLMDLGYSKMQIGNVKSIGLLMQIVGTFVGGVVMSRVNVLRGLLYCGLIQTLSPLALTVVGLFKHDESILLIFTGLRNFACGLGSTAFVTYLSSLCSGSFVATQFAVLYSLSSMSRMILATSATLLLTKLTTSWGVFYLYTTLLGILFTLPVVRLMHKSNLRTV